MDPTNAETIGLNYDGTLPQFKKNTLTVDTSRHTGHARSGSNKANPNLLSPDTIISGHSGGQDDRKNSTASALTDDTLVPSESASPFTPLTSADKGKQREDTSLFVPVRTPSYDYGTINIAPSPSEPVQAFGSPRDRTITLERVRRTTPQLVNEVQKLQQVSTWVDEEAQVVYYFGRCCCSTKQFGAKWHDENYVLAPGPCVTHCSRFGMNEVS